MAAFFFARAGDDNSVDGQTDREFSEMKDLFQKVWDYVANILRLGSGRESISVRVPTAGTERRVRIRVEVEGKCSREEPSED